MREPITIKEISNIENAVDKLLKKEMQRREDIYAPSRPFMKASSAPLKYLAKELFRDLFGEKKGKKMYMAYDTIIKNRVATKGENYFEIVKKLGL